ncbi:MULTISPECIES: LXG domain-containing protein [Bacillaceae]|uniref:LXG domain-containing protein n=1 Tax=Bacillaceae TaxID=186817 RepID=UPI000BFBF401|nr:MULTISPECIES: LXG domain-containing protein [Bacillaceae]PGT80387.1 hypothetical protein COD11_21265 [Bacillus sp. AFS040349]UGB31230.1 LXG domain-containing protein [Metabacillus sp. B2-18]
MKLLDNHSLQYSISDLISKLDSQKAQLNQVIISINELFNYQDSFTGKTADAIRLFYQDIHIPFLTFYSTLLEDYKKVLITLKDRSLDLENEPNGLIKQSFLEGELSDGLTQSEKSLVKLVNETNENLNTIEDIVHVPRVNDQDFLNATEDAHKEINQTVTDLISFDTENSKNLETVGKDIHMMEQYILEMQSILRSGRISVGNYSTVQTSVFTQRLSLLQSLHQKQNFDYMLLRSTVPSEYESMRKLLYLNNNSFYRIMTNSEDIAISGTGVAQNPDGAGTKRKSDNIITIEDKVEDGWGSDGVGNAGYSLEADIEERNIQGEIGASVVNTDNMDDIPDHVSQKILYGDMGISVPYGLESFTKSTIYGQNIGFKSEAGVAKSSFSHENSPLNGTFNFAQGEAKLNYEDYTYSAGAGVSAAKVELKVEPLNFFGYEPLEEWFGFNYDPFVGVDISLGSIGVSGSVGLETSIYAAYGVGVGVKAGLEKDENE